MTVVRRRIKTEYPKTDRTRIYFLARKGEIEGLIVEVPGQSTSHDRDGGCGIPHAHGYYASHILVAPLPIDGAVSQSDPGRSQFDSK